MYNQKRFYEEKARDAQTREQREQSEMFWLKAFNNWIKAVLINKYCKIRNQEIQRIYDLPLDYNGKLLHVLDIGCGQGQDIKKWSNKENRVSYLFGVDISPYALAEYTRRWEKLRPDEWYLFKSVAMSAADPKFYSHIQHTYYDIVSSQLCIHYMFNSQQNARNLFMNTLYNLLEGGFMILTIPDSMSIVKKIRELGVENNGYYVYGNNHFSMRFKSIDFDKALGCYGLEYGFYLQYAIGSKSSTGEITYVNEWLIEPQNLEKLLKDFSMEIVESSNFIEFYKYHRFAHEKLFYSFKLIFREGESMAKEFWYIAHLYKVVVAQKKSGKPTNEFTVHKRRDVLKKKF